MSDLIERQAAIEFIHSLYPSSPIMRRNRERWEEKYKPYIEVEKALEKLPSAQPESTRTFDELVVKYPDPELCTYKEYKGKPYYSIKYIENGETYVGYGTYNPKVLSQYLKEYFISSAQPTIEPEIIRCKDCKHYKAHDYTGKLACHYMAGVAVVRNPDDFCSRAERINNGIL